VGSRVHSAFDYHRCWAFVVVDDPIVVDLLPQLLPWCSGALQLYGVHLPLTFVLVLHLVPVPVVIVESVVRSLIIHLCVLYITCSLRYVDYICIVGDVRSFFVPLLRSLFTFGAIPVVVVVHCCSVLITIC